MINKYMSLWDESQWLTILAFGPCSISRIEWEIFFSSFFYCSNTNECSQTYSAKFCIIHQHFCTWSLKLSLVDGHVMTCPPKRGEIWRILFEMRNVCQKFEHFLPIRKLVVRWLWEQVNRKQLCKVAMIAVA